jgi:multiphosphoryl transfer protein
MTVGIVLVSHSAKLAEGAVELARAMATSSVRLAVAAGIPDPEHPLGCDPLRVRAAIDEVDGDDGVLVLMDLGSAILSAEFALDLLEPGQREHVLLCEAPLVEGLVAAAVQSMAGASLAEVAAHARAALDGKREHLANSVTEPSTEPAAPAVSPGDADAVTTFTAFTRHGLHARPAAAIVMAVGGLDATVTLRNLATSAEPVPAASINGILQLGVRHGDVVRVEARGPQAAAAAAAIDELAARNFDEDAERNPGQAAEVAAATTDREPGQTAAGHLRSPSDGPSPTGLVGLTASPGVGVGAATRISQSRPSALAHGGATDPAEQSRRLHAAIDAVAVSLRETIEAQTDAEVVAILRSQLLTLFDPLVVQAADELVAERGFDALRAWQAACDEMTGRIGALDDPYLAARAGDVSAIREEVSQRLEGAGDLGQLAGVLLARDLSPMQAAALLPGRVSAVATAEGSPSGHSAMILRAAGIPAVVALGPAILSTPEGATLVVDADSATVDTNPTAATLQLASVLIAEREAGRLTAQKAAGDAARTRDGVHIHVVANIALPVDAGRAAAAGADGVGLLRSEFIFADHGAAPTESEQVGIYTDICAAMGGRPVVLRTLDIGGDKPLPYLNLPPEANPFLGMRGIRLTLKHPDLLIPQLRAALRTAASYPLRLMLPMVSVADEITRTRVLLEKARDELLREGYQVPEYTPLGIMVETPTAALKAATLVPEVDFVSIGTNDLTQYTLAAERGNPNVAHLVREYDPSVLRLIAMVCSVAQKADVPVAVCGAAAEDARMVPLLLGLGVRELSVSAPNVGTVKAQVRNLNLGRAADLAAAALGSGTAEEVLALVARSSAGDTAAKEECAG